MKLSETELRYLTKMVAIVAVLIASIWGVETGALSALLL